MELPRRLYNNLPETVSSWTIIFTVSADGKWKASHGAWNVLIGSSGAAAKSATYFPRIPVLAEEISALVLRYSGNLKVVNAGMLDAGSGVVPSWAGRGSTGG